MSSIIVLPQEIVSKIAAGEVIERPCYAVKELIENALDAKASVIEVHVEESGLKRIMVIDNGQGMSKEDLKLCFLPHTTSKIKSIEELVCIKTLGFRGEALASIAAISNLTIQSRTKDTVGGTVVELNKGKVEKIAPVGMPVGTIITINQLFGPVPARKKFLKSLQTEFRHITDTVMHYALSHPQIHFVLTHNKKTVFDLAKKDTSLERIKLLLGTEFWEHVVPVEFEDSYIKVSGFLGKPQIASKNNHKQYIFVNNRQVTDKLISLAVKEAFATLLPSSYTPVFVLFLTLPHETVDVNVHPRKEQIAFVNPKQFFDTVKLAIVQTLQEHNLTFRLAMFKEESAKVSETQSFTGKLLKEIVLPWNTGSLQSTYQNADIIQIHKTYLLTTTKESVVITDQHAAHERILYEQFVQAFEKQKQQKQNYQLPKQKRIELSLAEGQLFEEFKDIFTNFGFDITTNKTSIVIKKIPLVFKGRRIEKIIHDMVDDLQNERGVQSIDRVTQRMLAYLSCRSAIMAGEVLTKQQAKRLLKELENLPNNSTCPHGRPTRTTISIKQLSRFFKRNS